MNAATEVSFGWEESAEQDAGVALPLAVVLARAIDFAWELNALHACGLAYGNASDGMAPRADGQRDVEAFGGVLADMLAGATVTAAEAGLHAQAVELAARCLEEAPGIRLVLIELRLLRMRARQDEAGTQTFAALPEPVAKLQDGIGAFLKSFVQNAAHAIFE